MLTKQEALDFVRGIIQMTADRMESGYEFDEEDARILWNCSTTIMRVIAAINESEAVEPKNGTH